MAGETMQPMPMSPRQSPAEIGSAAVQWACTRRGRTLVLTVVFCVVLLGLGGVRHREAISTQYHALSSTYQWRPYLPHIPAIIHAPFKTPSNTTLQLENGELTHVPPQLKKTTPNFHLVMPAERDSDDFCKTTLSAMLLNYPPPTIPNLFKEFQDDVKWERDTIISIRHYLHNTKFVHDDDLMLIVDGENSWFQLPSDVIIKQYARVLEDANVRLFNRYGVDENGFQKFNQTIVFGAEKMCERDDMACKYAPSSILPADMYGKADHFNIADRPARYLNSKMIMGPAKDLKVLFHAALRKFDSKHIQRQTVQSVFATIFGEQQLRREAEEKGKKPASSKIVDLFSSKSSKSSLARRLKAANFSHSKKVQHEFGIGLDYSHTLFQPFAYCNEDELIPLLHDNTTDLSKYQHPNSWAQYLALPPTLRETKPPFWRHDLAKINPSPNEKPAYIDKLEFNNELDDLPNRKTNWNHVPLLQNTYTGAIPAIVLNDPLAIFRLQDPDHAPSANITWNNMWYSPFRRALLRNYFRTPQSPMGYHNSLVGGDRAWDIRGGRGGVWTEAEQAWLPWGEVDGVCGTLAQLKEVFSDGRGVWMHETEADGEQKRLDEEMELSKKIEEVRKKEDDKENEKKEQEEKEKQEKEQKEKDEQAAKEAANVERLKLEEEQKKKFAEAEDEERKKEEEERQRHAAEEKIQRLETEEKTREFERLRMQMEEGGEKMGGQEGSVHDEAEGQSIGKRWSA
ncbi:hypothetical protein BKA63DRAFT_152117 [Paraphoma chrysanthemicola]|nr:hypothetical protein BKA63DRAFT_152117 [Paraphoma chrysanthemicola]